MSDQRLTPEREHRYRNIASNESLTMVSTRVLSEVFTELDATRRERDEARERLAAAGVSAGAHIVDLTRELDEARKDSARLDRIRTGGYVNAFNTIRTTFRPETLADPVKFREAIDDDIEIDAAMAKDGDA